MIKYDKIPDGMEAITKIRYRDPGMESVLTNIPGGVQVDFMHAVSSIAP